MERCFCVCGGQIASRLARAQSGYVLACDAVLGRDLFLVHCSCAMKAQNGHYFGVCELLSFVGHGGPPLVFLSGIISHGLHNQIAICGLPHNS